jgi:aminopeptidase
MTDPRVTRLAQTLVGYSTGIKEGDPVLVWGYSELARPLIVEVCREAIKRGAGPIATHMDLPELRDAMLESASEKVLQTQYDLLMHIADHVNASIRILAPDGRDAALATSDPKRVAQLEVSHAAVRQRLLYNSHMCITLFPTEAAARQVGMSEEEFADYVFAATDHDWAALSAGQKKVIDGVLAAADVISVQAEDTDLTLSVKGRGWENCDGRINMPDGEIMTSPVETSLQGHVAFSFPAIFPPVGGRTVEGVHLWFEDGRVVKATAKDGEEHLAAMLDLDAGSRYAGEFAFGSNDRLQRWIGHILFDEKMGGTLHIALGQSFPHIGGVNQSALHWDLITDLRRGSEIHVDGTLVQKDGRWVF